MSSHAHAQTHTHTHEPALDSPRPDTSRAPLSQRLATTTPVMVTAACPPSTADHDTAVAGDAPGYAELARRYGLEVVSEVTDALLVQACGGGGDAGEMASGWETATGVLVRVEGVGWMEPGELAGWLDGVDESVARAVVARQASLERMYELTPETWVHQDQLQSRLAQLSPAQQRAFLEHTPLRGPDVIDAIVAERTVRRARSQVGGAVSAAMGASAAANDQIEAHEARYRATLSQGGVAFEDEDMAIARQIAMLEDEALLTGWLTGTAGVEHTERLSGLMRQVRDRVEARFVEMNRAFEQDHVGRHLRSLEVVASDALLGARGFDKQAKLFFDNKFFNARWFAGRGLDIEALSIEQRLLKVLEFSALPGVSRHHWLTDIDFVANFSRGRPANRDALDNRRFRRRRDLQPMRDWLVARGAEFGFVKPYTSTASRGVSREGDFWRGGHQLEHWHFTYAPIALALQSAYIARFDAILPRVAARVMDYIASRFRPVPGGRGGAWDPAELDEATLLAALRAVGIQDYLTNVNLAGGR